MSRSILIPMTLLLLFSLGAVTFAGDTDFFPGEAQRFDPTVPTPESVFGFQVGEWHIRHDQLVAYMRQLAATSKRVHLETVGYTYERRPLIQLMISSPANIRKLEQLREKHLDWVQGKEMDPATVPLVIQLGYSVHGNEASGSNAAPLVAWYLAASENMEQLLANTIVILDPSLNPDGLDRFTSWVNSHKSSTPNPDPYDREHNERWPSGRTNHYWFDLNRDWLLLTHPESRARVAAFHRWYPNILTDFHEMGPDSTYYFQPGVPTRQNPHIPPRVLDLTRMIARYHARALDQRGVLYFSEQLFDDFYFGKGSTYPDIQGGVGILFEQASARGHVQENSYGGISLVKAVKNHITASFSTLRAGVENRTQLLQHQRDFFNAPRDRKEEPAAFVFGSESDPAREYEMLDIITRHQIRVHHLKRPVNQDETTISRGWVIPLDQPQRTLITSLFDPRTSFQDQTFYDVSSWHFGYAFNLPVLKLEGRNFDQTIVGEALDKAVFPSSRFSVTGPHYAYLISWDGYYAPRAAAELLENNVRVRYATNEFSVVTGVGEKQAKRGALVIPMGIQEQSEAEIHRLLAHLAERDGVEIQAVTTGLTAAGVDLGSPSLEALHMPKPLMIVGRGVSPNAAGEIWHLLDQRFHIPITIVEGRRFGTVDLGSYTHLILPPGATNLLTKKQGDDIAAWVRDGGVLTAIGESSAWALKQGLAKAEWKTRKETKKSDKEKSTPVVERKPFGDRANDRAKHIIGGAIFKGNLDQTHPLGYGMNSNTVALFKDSTDVMTLSENAYGTVVQYDAAPLMGGYASEDNVKRIAESAAVIAERAGDGAVILMVDNPNFRGFWLGATKLFVNGLFFANAL